MTEELECSYVMESKDGDWEIVKNFKNVVTKIAGGEDQVEDFKFFAPDMQNPDELLKAATQMLNGEGNKLRKC